MSTLRSSIVRWYAARRMVLGCIVLSGAMATSVAVLSQAAHTHADAHRVTRAVTYNGIGVVIEQTDSEVVVREIIPNSPADGQLFEGARLVSVNGMTPDSLPGWASAIRGEPGTQVELGIASRCGGQSVRTLTRDIVRLEY